MKESNIVSKAIKFIVGLVLAMTIVGGVCVIMHDTCYVFGDDVQYMRCTGSGHPFHITRDIGCTPEIGRFFPMAYFTYNILLPFQGLAPLSAGWHYGVHALFWCIFLVVSFALYRKLFSEKTQKYADVFALLLTLVVAQRTLEFFACLWTTEGLSMTFLTLGVYLLYRYSTTRKIGWLVASALAFCYLTFCSEHFFIIPLSIAIAGFLPVNGSSTDKKQGTAFLVAGLSFILIYLLWIVPQVSQAYDSSHGDHSTYLQNIVHIFMGQKFLFVTVLVFVYRLYLVFVKKEKYDLYGDVLLASGVVAMLGGFVLKLNWPLYYLPSLILSFPACIRCLDFSNKRNELISLAAVMLICGYYIVKIPTPVKEMWHRHSIEKVVMDDFISKVIPADKIAYYPMPNGERLEDEWTYSGVRDYIGFYKQDGCKELGSIEDVTSPCLLIIPGPLEYECRLNEVKEIVKKKGLEVCPIDTTDRYYVLKIYEQAR